MRRTSRQPLLRVAVTQKRRRGAPAERVHTTATAPYVDGAPRHAPVHASGWGGGSTHRPANNPVNAGRRACGSEKLASLACGARAAKWRARCGLPTPTTRDPWHEERQLRPVGTREHVGTFVFRRCRTACTARPKVEPHAGSLRPPFPHITPSAHARAHTHARLRQRRVHPIMSGPVGRLWCAVVRVRRAVGAYRHHPPALGTGAGRCTPSTCGCASATAALASMGIVRDPMDSDRRSA